MRIPCRDGGLEVFSRPFGGCTTKVDHHPSVHEDKVQGMTAHLPVCREDLVTSWSSRSPAPGTFQEVTGAAAAIDGAESLENKGWACLGFSWQELSARDVGAIVRG